MTQRIYLNKKMELLFIYVTLIVSIVEASINFYYDIVIL